ncbi:MAG TPA: hypothetical protein VKT99_20265 [Xanthobacteraceae bacterium]|jgi:hypothetical protein|nr:hypothetical protein [Xanthobacteraceae bacterium]
MSCYRRCVLLPTRPSADLALPAGARRAAPHSTAILAALTATALGAGLAQAQDAGQERDKPAPPASGQAALLKKLEQMEQRVRLLESRLKEKDAGELARAHAQAAVAAPPPADARPARDQPAKGQKDAEKKDAKQSNDRKEAGGAAKPDWAVLATRDITGKTAPTNPPNSIIGLTSSPVTGLSIGAYGEMMFGAMQNPAAGGQWQNGADIRRMVLLPTYAITDNIIFNAEIEWEHGGGAFDPDDKLHGEIDIEQLWIDFKIMDQFNWRAPGIDLIPIGYINEHHEPTAFYSVLRPELYNGLIPSTWMAPATSIYGRIAEGLYYTIQASSSLEDFGSDFSLRTDANTVPPFPTGYAPGIDGHNGLGFARPPIGDFRQLNNDIAVAGELSYSPPALPGFNGSVSAYFTPNTTPRGAYADNGTPLGRSSLTMFDAEFRYRLPNTGFEARGEYVLVDFGNPANLRANNDSDPTNNVGKTMYGYSGELAYHLPLGNILSSDWELVPFYRYTFQNAQTGGFAGTDLNMPTGAGQTQFHNVGIAVFPSPQLVLKATWQKVINRDPAGANSDSVLGGVGFFF